MQPALAHPTTAALANGVRWERRNLWLALLLAITLGPFLITWVWESPPWWIVAQFASMAVLLICFAMDVPSATWLRHSGLLATHPWHPVEATVLRDGVVRVAGQAVAVRLPAGHAHVIARTGRAWVVGGPGVVLLRVDGSQVVFLGRPGSSGAAGEPGRGDGEPYTAAGLELRRMQRKTAVLMLGYSLWITGMSISLAEGRWLGVHTVLGAGFIVAMAVSATWVFRQPSRPWTWVPGVLDPWSARGDLTTARGTAVLPDGRPVRVYLPLATTDFLGAVWEAGGFWVAGEPGRGRFVLGFPDAPLAAIGRFSSVRR